MKPMTNPSKKTPSEKRHYKQIESENVKRAFEGTTIITKQGYEVRLNKYNHCFNCELEFLNVKYPYKVTIEFRSFKNKTVQYPYHPSKYKTGFMGEGKYRCGGYGEAIPEYNYWDGFLRRCYSDRVQKISKSYIGCSADELWFNFQNFAKWFEENFNPELMKGWCLDKDILAKGNKIYSPETCCFVPNEINILFTNGYVKRGKYPKGVSYKHRINRYIAQYQNNGKVLHIGTYKTIEEAFLTYKEVKEDYIKQKADEWKSKIDIKVYESMYKYQVEITD
jgi:hypothetical protein